MISLQECIDDLLSKTVSIDAVREVCPYSSIYSTIQDAERFSKQTGRPIILRLKFPDDAPVLEGHRGMARYINESYPVGDIFGKTQG